MTETRKMDIYIIITATKGEKGNCIFLYKL